MISRYYPKLHFPSDITNVKSVLTFHHKYIANSKFSFTQDKDNTLKKIETEAGNHEIS